MKETVDENLIPCFLGRLVVTDVRTSVDGVGESFQGSERKAARELRDITRSITATAVTTVHVS